MTNCELEYPLLLFIVFVLTCWWSGDLTPQCNSTTGTTAGTRPEGRMEEGRGTAKHCRAMVMCDKSHATGEFQTAVGGEKENVHYCVIGDNGMG